MIRVCFVCLGNICRSPTAEGVMRHLLREEGLQDQIELDSAGTGAYHVGEAPDRRSRAAAKKRGIRVDGSARQFVRQDLGRFDYVIAMDQSNLQRLQAMAKGHQGHKLSLLRDFDDAAPEGAEVPDPYYGGSDGFDRVLDICEAGCRGLLAHLRKTHQF
ncbi:MAG: low molecular weight protein-tyrosine-phosphatase [Myxococcota bacterium]